PSRRCWPYGLRGRAGHGKILSKCGSLHPAFSYERVARSRRIANQRGEGPGRRLPVMECGGRRKASVNDKDGTNPGVANMTSTDLATDLPRGVHLLRDPRLNKSTAFTEPEREALALTGLVPEGLDTQENQLRRVLLQLSQKTTDLDRYIYLSSLQDND